MNILITVLLSIWMLVALLMILLILMQRPKSEGLGAAFGGGVTENIFGAQTTTVLTKATAWFAAIFFGLTFALSVLYAHKNNRESALSRELKSAAPVPAAGTSLSPAPGASIAPGTSPAVALPTGSAKPSDLAVGAIPPAAAPVNPSPVAAPSASAKPKP
jgi:preprotein translocase subunit SecG